MVAKLWKTKEYDISTVLSIQKNYDLPRVQAVLSAARCQEDICGMASPYLFDDIKKAVDRINLAISRNEKITVYGDYDADGVTATALLYLYLKNEHNANVNTYIPDRMSEGYGLNEDAIRKLHEDGTQLIITVDNGIGAVDLAELISDLSMDLIITDHHLGSESTPRAVAVLNCNTEGYKGDFRSFAGVGVAFKLVCALDGNSERVLEKYADIVAVGTVGDVMPMINENRLIVKKGIEVIEKSPRTGIVSLIKCADIGQRAITAGSIAFGIVPRINAAGRMGSAKTALELLITDDVSKADEIAEQICKENIRRHETESKITAEVEKKLLSHKTDRYQKIIVADGDDWHDGVIGIVASRIVDRFSKPAVIISRHEDKAKGSGRSIDGFSLHSALNSVSHLFSNFGGHDKAAGFSLSCDDIEKLKNELSENLREIEMPCVELVLDCDIDISEIDIELCDFLKGMEPFGVGNEEPIFGMFNLKLENICPVSNGKHLRLTFSHGNSRIQAMYFGVSADMFDYKIGDTVDIAVNLEKNEYMGRVKPAVYVRDMRLSGIDFSSMIKGERVFEKYKRGEKITADEAELLLPERKILEETYRYIRQNLNFNPVAVCKTLGMYGDCYAKVLVAVEVLLERNLIASSGYNEYIIANTEKTDINESSVLIDLRRIADE